MQNLIQLQHRCYAWNTNVRIRKVAASSGWIMCRLVAHFEENLFYIFDNSKLSKEWLNFIRFFFQLIITFGSAKITKSGSFVLITKQNI
ncbi:hypothetical protein T07_86 [Trichinella nelsoni]|uniref:Uncharacterized protein n=1 Tax=Trichinella nelsoni TaxID=6336 RepID=A0A0V0RQ11_9BILA|nr:hypothetical protein T07_86 [Trichinella nelsoni]